MVSETFDIDCLAAYKLAYKYAEQNFKTTKDQKKLNENYSLI